jgi:hypothetical protein
MTDPRERFEELLTDWLDEALSPEDHAEWEGLLADHPDWAEEARQESELVGLLKISASSTKAPADFSHKLLDAIQSENVRQEESHCWEGFQRIGLLAAGLLVFGSIYYFQGDRGSIAPEMGIPDSSPVPSVALLESEADVTRETGRQIAEVVAPTPASRPLETFSRAATPMPVEEREEAPARVMAAMAPPPAIPTDFLFITSDPVLAALTPVEHRGNHMIARASLPPVLMTFYDQALEVEELDATISEEEPVFLLESAGGALLDQRASRLALLGESGLDLPEGLADATVEAWEYSAPGNALAAFQALTAQDPTLTVEVLPRGTNWVVLIPSEEETIENE